MTGTEYEQSWTRIPSERIQQWTEQPRFLPGSFSGGRIKPKYSSTSRSTDGDNVVEALEWEPAVEQRRDLRLSLKKRTRGQDGRGKQGGNVLVRPSIDPKGESEWFDLVGNPLDFVNDSTLLSNLHSSLPETPLHPTIFLNTHFSSAPNSSFTSSQTDNQKKPSRIVSTFEPSDLNRGNCIASIRIDNLAAGERSSVDCIAWRMGDSVNKRPTSVGLGLSVQSTSGGGKGKEKAIDQDEPFTTTLHSTTRSSFYPFQDPLLNLMTPIQQLHFTSTSNSSTTPHLILGIRSLTSFELVHLSLPTPFDPGKQQQQQVLTITSRSIYSGSDLAKNSIADFTLRGISQGYGEIGNGLIVDVEGNLFGWSELRTYDEAGQSKPEMFLLRKGIKRGKVRSEGYSGMARVAYGGGGGGNEKKAIVAVEDQVKLYDLRSSRDQVELVGRGMLERFCRRTGGGRRDGEHYVTSLLERSPSYSTTMSTSTTIHPICTTRDIVWVDERMPGREVLRWGHDRVGIEGKGVDRTLAIKEVPSNQDETAYPSDSQTSLQRFALYSRQNPELTIFTTSLNPHEAPKSLLDPYSISNPTLNGRDRDGLGGGGGGGGYEEGPYRRTGLTFVPSGATLSSSGALRTKDQGNGASRDGDEEMNDVSSEDEESNRRRRVLERMTSEEEEYRNDERSKKCDRRQWRMLEIDIFGGVVERELDLRQKESNDVEEDEEMEEDKVDADDDEEDKVGLFGDRWRGEGRHTVHGERIVTRRIDMSAVVESMTGERLLGERKMNEDGIHSAERSQKNAVKMLELAVSEAKDNEGDVGALTALELLDLASSVPAPPDEPDTASDEEEAQKPNPSSTIQTRIENLPRPSSFVPSSDRPPLISSALEANRSTIDSTVTSLLEETPASIRLFDQPESHFTATTSPSLTNPQDSIADKAQRLRDLHGLPNDPTLPSSRACDLVAAELDLSATVLLPRSIEIDVPTATPNQPFPATEEPPPVQLSYLRPVVDEGRSGGEDEDSEDDLATTRKRKARIKKPPLQSLGTRLLLAEWHVGSDPRNYTWSNPYEGEKAKDDPFLQSQMSQSQSQRRKGGKGGKKKRDEEEKGGFRQSQFPPSFGSQPSIVTSSSRFDFPSAFPSSSASQSQAYFPSLGTRPTLDRISDFAPPPPSSSQSQDWTQAAATQPVISITDTSSSSNLVNGNLSSHPSHAHHGSRTFGKGTASQIVPGAFGSRNGVGQGGLRGLTPKEKEKKKAKKRVSGF